MKIFVNHINQKRLNKSTDFRYSKNFKLLESFQDTQIIFNNSRVSGFIMLLGWTLLKRLRKAKHLSALEWPVRFLAMRTIIWPWQVHDCDVIISHHFFPMVLSFGRRPPIIFCSGFPSNEYERVSSDRERKKSLKFKLSMQNNFDSDVVVFPAGTERWVEHLRRLNPGTPQTPIQLIPKLLPNVHSIAEEQLEKKFSDFDRKLKLSFIGMNGERKGLLETIEALKYISKHHPQIAARLDVTIVSETQFSAIDGLSIQRHSYLNHADVTRIMHDSHIFCLPTKRDSYGLVFVEAMSAGCAIIADNKSPRTSFFKSEQDALLVEPGDYGQIVDAIVRLASDAEFSKSLAIRARQKFIQQYSIDIAKRRFYDLARQLTQKARKSSGIVISHKESLNV